MRERGGVILTYEEEEYPDRLREIFDPPPVLWVLGNVKLLSRPSIAVVGTRHPTPYGTGHGGDIGARPGQPAGW